MKISFESTIEELADCEVRREDCYGVLRRRMLLGTVGLLAIVLVLYLLIPGRPAEKTAFGVVAAVVAGGYFVATYRSSHRKRVYDRLAEAYGSNQPALAEYELTPEGIVFRRSGFEKWYSWEDVRDLRETKDSLELVTAPDGLLVFPKRVFSNPEERLACLDYIHAQVSATPSPGGPTGEEP